MKRTVTLLFYIILPLCVLSRNLKHPNSIDFEIDLHIRKSGVFSKDERFTFQLKLLSAGSNQRTYSCMLVKVISLQNLGPKNIVALDTDKGLRNTKFSSYVTMARLALLNQPLKLIVNRSGGLVGIKGLEESVKHAKITWGLGKNAESAIENGIGMFAEYVIKPMFVTLPGKKPVPGLRWADGAASYRITDIKGDLVTFNGTTPGQSSGSPLLKGKSIFNRTTGLIEHSYFHGVSDTGKTDCHRQIVTKGWHISRVDTAWLNMAFKASHISDALKTGFAYDPQKIQAFFDQYDAQFSADTYYRVEKLNLIQQIISSGERNRYFDLLVSTPNFLIKDDPSHLIDKLEYFTNRSADSAYAIGKYLFEQPIFMDWLQESFSQVFQDTSNDQAEKKDRTNIAYELLRKFEEDKSPSLRRKITPLVLWVRARDGKNTAQLLNTSLRFRHMDDSTRQEGNSSRYALLTYKLLLQANLRTEADSLLLNTVGHLEGFVADTLNTMRNAERNLLAHAYYLRYKFENSTDTSLAMKFLEKAALHSPKNNAQKAYGSTYDRAFLNSKESYEPDFIEKLFKEGENKNALATFAAYARTQPTEIEGLGSLYKKYFPDRKFRDFFLNDIINGWDDAPPFVLKGLDGRAYDLLDYRGQWLLIDFWGTWCAPCRNEMPGLNLFDSEIKLGKHKGVKFLSIACSDRETNVRDYLKSGKYQISVVMSDGKIEERYKVNGYPTKIIVSPQGKMIALKFEDDWKNTIQRFVGLCNTDQ